MHQKRQAEGVRTSAQAAAERAPGRRLAYSLLWSERGGRCADGFSENRCKCSSRSDRTARNVALRDRVLTIAVGAQSDTSPFVHVSLTSMPRAV